MKLMLPTAEVVTLAMALTPMRYAPARRRLPFFFLRVCAGSVSTGRWPVLAFDRRWPGPRRGHRCFSGQRQSWRPCQGPWRVGIVGLLTLSRVCFFCSPIDMFVGPWSRVSKRATNQVVSVVGGLGGIMLGWRRGEAVSSLNSWNRPSGVVTLMLYPVDRCVLGFFFFHPAVV